MKEIEKQIKQLSTAEKILLVENIWDSIAEEHESTLTAKQKKELDRRLALIESGKATFFYSERNKGEVQGTEMKYNYRVLDIAVNEILEASVWYEDKRDGLGDELIFCFEASLETILRNPLLFEKRYRNLRLASIKRFPYQLVYYIEGHVITVVAFSHEKRNPKYWRRRYRL